jgi:hypothetical protein
VPKLPTDLYGRWLALAHPEVALREDRETPPERWLQQIWRHQRLRREALTTIDGRPLRVLHPGFWNREPGPDFHDAVLQFGEGGTVTGDVEIDVATSGWRGHGHHDNPAYQKVVLHVVWDSASSNDPKPLLALRPFLDSPIAELAEWLTCEATELVPVHVAGQCSGPLGDLSADLIEELLLLAARVRLERKAAVIAARARDAGWEQALREGLFSALGYKHNIWPMRRIAELTAQFPVAGARSSAEKDDSVLLWQARLFGLSGQLPAELEESEASRYVRQLWDHWWRERDPFADSLLPATLWRAGGNRPANHPQRRLALAAHWLAAGELASTLEQWLSEPLTPAAALPALARRLQPSLRDPFWEHHWTLRSAKLARPQPLLGESRITDLAMNVILPWLWVRARRGGNGELLQTVEQRYFEWPEGEDNSVLRLARQRLLGRWQNPKPATAAAQQGLLQIVRDFCDHSSALCTDCRFPGLVRSLRL